MQDVGPEKGGEHYMKFQYRIGTAVASSALMFQMLAPAAFADTTVTISGNGDSSTNDVNVTNNNSSNITQNNSFTVELNITSEAKTGKNRANNNTGGNVDIFTGDATSTVNVTVAGGDNTVNAQACPCNTTDNVTVSGNGVNSGNTANVTNNSNQTANQSTNATVKVQKLKSKAKTGKNKANNNTNGTVNVTTGNATDNVTVNVTAPSNTLNVTP